MQKTGDVSPIAQTLKRISLGALELDRLSLDGALERIEQAVQGHTPPLQVVTANTQFLGMARKNPAFAGVVRQAGMVVADGVPLLWLCRLQKEVPGARITGHDLLHACADLAARRGYSIAFLGGTPDVAASAGQELTRRHPGLRIAGMFQGMFNQDGTGATQSDDEQVAAAIQRAKPDILFVALGCPKQELWAARNQRELCIPAVIGIGGVLDVIAGRFKRAPRFVQRLGLEWAFRLAQDPRRLWKRYVLEDVPTLTVSTLAALRTRAMDKGQAA